MDPTPNFNEDSIHTAVEAILQEVAEQDSDEIEMRASDIQTEQRVVQALLQAGADIPFLTLFDQETDDLTMHEIAGMHEVAGILGFFEQDTKSQEDISEEDTVIQNAQEFVRVHALLEYISSMGQLVSLWDQLGDEPYTAQEKLREQLDILGDEKLREQDKALLLEVCDELVPTQDSGLTDQIKINRISKEEDDSYVRLKTMREAQGVLSSIFQTELTPVYGEHDSYDELLGHIKFVLMVQKEVARGAKTQADAAGLINDFMEQIFAVANDIGIPEDVVKSVLAKADFLL